MSPVALFRLSIAIVLVALGARAVTETDVWGHIRFGLDLLQSHRLPATDPYSFTSTQAWINHEWLSQLLFAAAYRWGGLPLLIAFRAGCVICLLAAVNASAQAIDWPRRDALLIAVLFASLGQLSAVRPQALTLTIYTIVLLGVTRDALWLPGIFALWANLHAGWLFGFGAVAVRAVLKPGARRYVLAAACFVATLANPYGWRLWLAIFDAMGRGWSEVSEWAPVTQPGLGIGAFGLWMSIASIGVWIGWRGKVADPWAWIWTALTAAAAFRSRRLMALFAITTAMLLIAPVRFRARSVPAFVWSPGLIAIVAVPLAASILVSQSLVAPVLKCLPPVSASISPEASAVAFLRQHNLRGRVLIWFDYGLYALWQAGDRVKVSIDNRRETVYSADVVDAHSRFYHGLDPAYADRIGADYVWVERSLAPVGQLEQRGWFEIFRGDRSVILGRTFMETVRVNGSDTGACFPNP